MNGQKILKRVGSVLCALLLVCSTLGAVVLAWVQGTLFSEEFFLSACDEVYLKELEGFLMKSLTGELARYEESEEVQNRIAKQCLDMDAVALCSREHLRSLYRSLTEGTQLVDAQYPLDRFTPFRDHVHALSEETGDEVSEEVLDELVAGFAARVSSDINCFHFNLVGFSSTSLIRMAHEKVFSGTLKSLLSISFWIPLAVAVACAAGLFFLSSAKESVRKAYVTCTCFWIATSLLFFPVILFSVYDLPSRLAITASPVKSLLDRILYHLIDGIAVPVSVLFVVASLAVLACIVLQMRSYAKKLKEQEQSHREAAEEASALMAVESLAQLPEGEESSALPEEADESPCEEASEALEPPCEEASEQEAEEAAEEPAAQREDEPVQEASPEESPEASMQEE